MVRLGMDRSNLTIVAAYAWAALVIAVARFGFDSHPPAGYGDLFLFGPAVLSMTHSWKSAAILFALSLGGMACMDPPIGVKIFGYSMILTTGAVCIGTVSASRSRAARR